MSHHGHGDPVLGSGLILDKEANDSQIKSVIAVMSGKGGVGKSSVTGLIAAALARTGKKVGIMDADITGPSIPKIFGITTRPTSADNKIVPVQSKLGIKVMSLNLLLENEDDPVIWRGPLIAGAVEQFWKDVAWGELDYLIIDSPPGTGDAPLTLMQTLPLSGVIIVASPQDLALMVVRKAIKMADKMNIPVLGLIENMSYVKCPNCGEKIEIFGPSQGEGVAHTFAVPFLGSLPLDPNLSELCDQGRIEEYESEVVNRLIGNLEHLN